MELTSSAFEHGGKIPRIYAYKGGNKIPPLEIQNVPRGAKSLVLIIDDYDVPKDLCPSGFYDHWVVFNIPTTTTNITEGVQGKNSDGQNCYIGPAPPDREHRYNFKLYAIDTMLGLPEGATKTEVEKAIEGHILEKAVLMGRFAPIKY